ncbi:unnamed protein product, partial [Orchesella dallaii]
VSQGETTLLFTIYYNHRYLAFVTMRGITALFAGAALLCNFASASVIHGKPEKEPIEDLPQFTSDLVHLLPSNNDVPILTTCNGVLNSTTGGIAYKAFEPISVNERCVWTIRGGRAGGFSLNVLNTGSANSQDTNLIATCLQHGRGATHISLNQTGLVNGVSACNLIIITLASGSDVSNATGFVLEYSVTRASTISPTSEDYIVTSENPGVIRYPNSAVYYNNNELTTFVILPVSRSTTNVIYLKGTLESSSCYDNLSVYRFNAASTSSSKYEYVGRICGNSASDLIANQDLILITFDSDVSNTGTGFQLALAASSSSECSA